MNNTYISHSEQETLTLAKEFASTLRCGDVVVLTGDLGAGKTKFVEGILSYFGLENEISSPTFTIVNEYDAPNVPIYHFDVYRLESIDEFYAIGGEEYFSNGICIIEWGEMIAEVLPTNYTAIIFQKDTQQENTRIIEVKKISKTAN